MLLSELVSSHKIPPWSMTTDDYSYPLSPNATDDYSLVSAALQRYLPSNVENINASDDFFSCDHFRMYEFKVRKCTRAKSHDWTDCPFAHPAEKATRRDPTKFHYSATSCPDFRRGSCRKGDACEYAHGVFESWLHPARYRTQPCKDGMCCKRRVCFFAHSPHQLRVLSHGTEFGSPVEEMLRKLKLNSGSWVGLNRPCLATTLTRPGIGYFEEEMGMEMVESGRELRAKMFEKLSKENPLDRVKKDPNPNPDVGWVVELVE